MFAEWYRRVVLRTADRREVFTVHPRRVLTSSARLSGRFPTTIRRRGRAYVSAQTTFTQAASGVLTGAHGEIIVYDVPETGELMRLRFAPSAAPAARAAMIGIAVLYEHDLRR